jgi:hypothetical protein
LGCGSNRARRSRTGRCGIRFHGPGAGTDIPEHPGHAGCNSDPGHSDASAGIDHSTNDPNDSGDNNAEHDDAKRYHPELSNTRHDAAANHNSEQHKPKRHNPEYNVSESNGSERESGTNAGSHS